MDMISTYSIIENRSIEKYDISISQHSFKLLLKWILSLIVAKYPHESNSTSKASLYLREWTNNNQLKLSLDFANQLQSIYSMTATILFQNADKTARDFLDQLVDNGFLNYKPSSLTSIRTMLTETNPFYESVHTNIILAFISAYQESKLCIENIVDHLKIKFPSYNPIRLYPFDLEDAILIWCNQCIHELNTKAHPIKSRCLDEIDDLVVGLKDGNLILQMIYFYFSSSTERKDTLQSFDELIMKCQELGLQYPWTDIEIEWAENQSHLKSLLICFFCDLFELIQISSQIVDSKEGELCMERLSDELADKNDELQENLEHETFSETINASLDNADNIKEFSMDEESIQTVVEENEKEEKEEMNHFPPSSLEIETQLYDTSIQSFYELQDDEDDQVIDNNSIILSNEEENSQGKIVIQSNLAHLLLLDDESSQTENKIDQSVEMKQPHDIHYSYECPPLLPNASQSTLYHEDEEEKQGIEKTESKTSDNILQDTIQESEKVVSENDLEIKRYATQETQNERPFTGENCISITLSSSLNSTKRHHQSRKEEESEEIVKQDSQVTLKDTNEPSKEKIGLIFIPLDDASPNKVAHRTFSRHSNRASSAASSQKSFSKEQVVKKNQDVKKESEDAQEEDVDALRDIPNPPCTPIPSETPKTQESSKKEKKSVSTPHAKPLTNRPLVKNALVHVCLAGTVNQQVKKDVLSDLEKTNETQFIILFRQVNNFSFRGLYAFDSTSNQAVKVYQTSHGPEIINSDMIAEFYKYDSGGRTFKSVPTRSFGKSVHAIALNGKYTR